MSDRLHSVGFKRLKYAESTSLGNPVSSGFYDNNNVMTSGDLYSWEGRKLTRFRHEVNQVTQLDVHYTYDANGLRIRKQAGTVEHKYVYDGANLAYETFGTTSLRFGYDENGFLSCLTYRDGTTSTRYFYVRDILLNIIGLKDLSGNLVVRYHYDAWGNITSVTGSGATTIGQANPFGYKGYYYDAETMMYYCQTRYYVPQWCRWLNADNPNYLDINSPKGINLFAYCGNNPVMYSDQDGTIPQWVWWVLGALVVIGLAIAVIATAGGITPALAAVWSAANGIAYGTLAITVTSFAFVGAATVYGGALVYNGLNIATAELRGSSYDVAFNDMMNMGPAVFGMTVTAGLAGAYGGYISYNNQLGGLGHSWTTERKNFFKTNPDSPESSVLHHPYGRQGANIKYYFPVSVSEHAAIHHVLGYGNGQGGFWQYRELINWWNLLLSWL